MSQPQYLYDLPHRHSGRPHRTPLRLVARGCQVAFKYRRESRLNGRQELSAMRRNPQVRVAFCAPTSQSSSSIPPTANVPHAPHRAPAYLPYSCSGNADTIYPCPTRSACVGHLGGYAVRLMKRHERNGQRRRRNDCRNGSKRDQPDHYFSPRFDKNNKHQLILMRTH